MRNGSENPDTGRKYSPTGPKAEAGYIMQDGQHNSYNGGHRTRRKRRRSRQKIYFYNII